jgi:hypothetical protein
MATIVWQAGPEALSFVLTLERRQPRGWDEERHRSTLGDPDAVYLLGARGPGQPEGYSVLVGPDEAEGRVTVERVAVTDPQGDFGQTFVEAVLDWAFARAEARRLDVLTEAADDSALESFRSLGFGDIRRETVVTVTRAQWISRR